MSGKRRNLPRENEARRQETKKRRADKVVVGYVKALYPVIFQQASEYYVKLDQANPQKLDLTKTLEFRTLQKNKIAVADNFELKIELIDNGKQTEKTTPALEAEATPSLTPQLIDNGKQTETTTQTVKTTPALEAEATPSLTPQPTTDTTCETLLTPLDQETLEAIIADLRQEPFMDDFLNNIEFEQDSCPLW